MNRNQKQAHDPLKPVAMLLLATVFWGLSFPLMKGLVLSQQRLLPGANVWFVTAQTLVVRFGLAAIVLAVLFPKRMRRFSWLEIKLGVGLGFFAGVGTLFQMAALGQTLASTSAFLTQFTVLFVPLWLSLTRRRLPSPVLVACCGLVVIGMGVLCGVEWGNFRLRHGEWLTVLAAALFTGDILWLDRREFVPANKLRATVVMFATMALILVPVMMWGAPKGADGWWNVYRSPAVLLMMGLLLSGSTLAAFTIMNFWQPDIRPTHAGLIYCVEPVMASIYALCLPEWLSKLGGFNYPNEQLTPDLWIGGALITVANVLIQLAPRER